MQKAGKIKGPLHVQFVMGVKNAMPVDRETFDFYVRTLKRLDPSATWTRSDAEGGQDQGPAARAVRDGSEERDAGRSRDIRLLCAHLETAGSERDLDPI